MKLTRNVPQRRVHHKIQDMGALAILVVIALAATLTTEILTGSHHRAGKLTRTPFTNPAPDATPSPLPKCTSPLTVTPCRLVVTYDYLGTDLYGTGSAGSPLTTRHVPQ